MKICGFVIIVLLVQSVQCGFVEPEPGSQNFIGWTGSLFQGLASDLLGIKITVRNNDEVRRATITADKFKNELENIGFKLTEMVHMVTRGNFAFSPLGAALQLTTAAVASSGNTKFEIKELLNLTKAQDYDILPLVENFVQQTIEPLKDNDLIFENFVTTLNHKPNGQYAEKIMKSFNLRHSDNDPLKNHGANNDHSNNILKASWRDSSIVFDSIVSYESNWMTPFKLRTYSNFMTENNFQKRVEMIGSRNWFYHGSIPEWSAHFVEVPCKGDIKMIFVLPTSDVIRTSHIEHGLHELQQIIKRTRKQEVIALWIPSFRVQSHIFLKSHLKELNVNNMFSSRANFTKFWKEKPHHIHDFRQRTFIDVHGNGISNYNDRNDLFSGGQLPTLSIDQPFIAVVVHKETTLLVVKVENPLD